MSGHGIAILNDFLSIPLSLTPAIAYVALVICVSR